MARRTTAAEKAPTCRHCGGMALEPGVFPATNCTRCAGTGRPPAPPAPPPQEELING